MAGMTAEKILEIHARRLRKGWIGGRSADLLDEVRSQMLAGHNLASALRRFVPDSEYLLISSAEMNGDLAEALKQILSIGQMSLAARKEIVKLYLTILIYASLLVGVVVFLGWSIVPELEKTSDPAAVEAQLHYTMLLYRPMRDYGLLLLGLTACIVTFARWSLANLNGSLRLFLEFLPPWRNYRNQEGFVWLLSFVSLVHGGMSEGVALRKQSESASPWLKERLDAIYARLIEDAYLFPQALDVAGYKFPSPALIDEIDTFWTGQSDDYALLVEAAKTWADDAKERAIAVSRMTNVACQIVVMAVIGVLALETAFISPEIN